MLARSMFFALVAAMAVATPALAQPAVPPSSTPQSAGSAFNDAQRREIERLIGEYIRNNPEAILDAVRAHQERAQANQRQRQHEALVSLRSELERDADSPVAGNAEGDVTIVEFFDYRCSYCKSVFPAIQRLLKDDPKVRYVLKELPILSPESRIAARLALAVWKAEPKRYFALHGKLMEARGELSERRIFDIARDAGVDVERARRGMDSPDIERALERNMQHAQALGISGTPGFVVGDRMVPGAIDLEAMKQLIAEARRGG